MHDLKFFARIELEGEKQYTEHSLLTDICDLDATADKYSTACLIGNSIMCYSQQNYNGMRPKVGDIVKIKLRPGRRTPRYSTRRLLWVLILLQKLVAPLPPPNPVKQI